MKKIIFNGIILLMGINSSYAQTTDFRIFSWGNPMEKIKTDEKSPFFSTLKSDELEYDDKLGGSKIGRAHV